MHLGAHVDELAGHLRGAARFVVMSGHDTTLAPLLAMVRAHGEATQYQPDVASFVSIEVYDDATVKVLVRTRLGEQPAYVTLAACGAEKCGLEQFIGELERYRATWEQISLLCAQEPPASLAGPTR